MISQIEDAGYEPHVVPMDMDSRNTLLDEINAKAMHDDRGACADGLLLASPFGFRSVADIDKFQEIFPPPIVELNFGDDFIESAPSPD